MIMKIAMKLAGLPCEIEFLFGIFSNGQRNCTKEDFSHCCLNRLNLRKDVTEKEMQYFLQVNEHLREKTYIEKDDFVSVFKPAIIKARNEQ